MTRPDWVEVGRVRRAHGTQGEVRVHPLTDNPERFAPGSHVYARRSGEERRLLVIRSIRGDVAVPIVAFAGVLSRDDAEALQGAVLEVPGDDLPDLEEGEYYPFQLAGLEVRTAAGERVGEVVELLDAPANDVLVLRMADGRQHLVPFVEPAVPTVDLAAGFLVVEESFLLPPEDVR